MFFLFGIPISRFIRRIFTEPVLVIRTILVYIWLLFRKREPRIHLYEPHSDDLTKLNGLIPEEHYAVENGEKPIGRHTSDSVLFYGGHTSGWRLVVHACRELEGNVAGLYLKLPDGRIFQMLHPDKSYAPSNDFNAGGLRIKCYLPMRKWRVAFNGLLRESREGEENPRGKVSRVQFSFIINHNGYPFDLRTDIHPSLMADHLAQSSKFPFPPPVKRVTQYLDNYWQPCNMLGSITINETEESEVFLWGVKKRSRDILIGRPMNSARSTELFLYSKDGQNIYSGDFILPGSKTRLSVAQYRERNGIVWPVRYCNNVTNKGLEEFNGIKMLILTDMAKANVLVNSTKRAFSCLAGGSLGHAMHIYLTDFKTEDGDNGHAIVIENTGTRFESHPLEKLEWRLHTSCLDMTRDLSPRLVLCLDHPECQLPALTGGKGASLASLTYLATKYQTSYTVPWGFVVTTEAYWNFLAKSNTQDCLEDCETASRSSDPTVMKNTCNRVVSMLSKSPMPGVIQSYIQNALSERFGPFGQQKRFAVRSSASGEDSEDMSAAGQMSTFLGLQGIESISQAVVKCWSSQFSFNAVQYKRQNGQELNSPMAVIIQEMVDADTAGVLFTCDPVNGDPRNVTITANYGIGESVVSASVEPDTLVMNRDEHNQITLKNVTVGRKKTKIMMSDGGSVMEIANDDAAMSVCCLSPENAKILAETSLKVEVAYGFPVDIEWAFKDERLYLLQARPITTLYKETKFEVLHSADLPLRVENEYLTKSNVGEVMPGFMSHLSCSILSAGNSIAMQRAFGKRNKYMFPFDLFRALVEISQNHIFFSMPGSVLRFYQKDSKFVAHANMIASFGRLIDEPEMFDQAEKRNSNYPSVFIPLQLCYIIRDLLFAERDLKKQIKLVWDIDIDLSGCADSKEMFLTLLKRTFEESQGSVSHLICTANSAIYNNILFAVLMSRTKEWNSTVFHDFSKILASCGEPESANIPRAIEELTTAIAKEMDINKFKEMDPQEALNWLETTDDVSGTLYRQFLTRHGHRCYKEFDVATKTWRMDKLPMIRTFQDFVGKSSNIVKTEVPVREIISQLQVPLSRSSRYLLKKIIPLCRKAVYNRELSKSMMIKMIDHFRKAAWEIAEQMEKEGRLPDKELLFFLSHHEISQLLDSRSPQLIQRAVRRRQVSTELDKLRFPELFKGIPKAVNLVKKCEDIDYNSDLEIIGTPVSQGVAKGYARVAVELEDAAEIKQDEILIAYSTDIAWSAYFPLLSGVVTELGGLISHGAVVAREYGLPCVVAAVDATLKFRTGDYVLLDGNKGILKRLDTQDAVTSM